MQNLAFEDIEISASPSAPPAQPEVVPSENVSPTSVTATTTAAVSAEDNIEQQIVPEELENSTFPPVPENDAAAAAVEVVDVEYRYPRNYLLSDINSLISDPLMRRQNPPVLEKISISAPRGRIYALLGSSGCGKFPFHHKKSFFSYRQSHCNLPHLFSPRKNDPTKMHPRTDQAKRRPHPPFWPGAGQSALSGAGPRRRLHAPGAGPFSRLYHHRDAALLWPAVPHERRGDQGALHLHCRLSQSADEGALGEPAFR